PRPAASLLASPHPASTQPAAGEPPAVEFRGVSFAYGSGAPVLHEVSFAVRRGQRVAVVGHTGAGKTTLVSLLCRFHETREGAISLHGRDVRSIPHKELLRRIAI